MHYASFAAFLLAFVHGIAIGTEPATLWASSLYLTTAGLAILPSLYPVLSTARVRNVLLGRGAVVQPL